MVKWAKKRTKNTYRCDNRAQNNYYGSVNMGGVKIK